MTQDLFDWRGVDLFEAFYFENILYREEMGLHMDDIHTPTVASGPTSGSEPAYDTDKNKLSLMDLINEKTRVEGELSALGNVLDSVCYTIRCCL